MPKPQLDMAHVTHRMNAQYKELNPQKPRTETNISNTTAEKPLNVRLPIELAAQLEAFTKATGRTKSFLAVEALEAYIDQQNWQIAEVKAGVEEADRGEFATDEEMEAIFAKYAN